VILQVHPFGNTFSRALLEALQEVNLLGLFATTIAVDEGSALVRALPKKLRAELLRRRYDVPREKLFTRPLREAARMVARRFGLSALDRHETGWASFDAVCRDLDETLAKRLAPLAQKHRLTGVYAYEDGALSLFRRARDLGLARCYDLPIAYWETARRLLREEGDRLPEWKHTIKAIVDSDEKTVRKTAEIELAEVVVCPSQFVLDSIPENIRRGRRCVVSEFGSPAPWKSESRRAKGGPLRVLFAGSMTQRKGLGDLFVAMKIIGRKDVQLVVLGSPAAPMEFYRAQFPDFIYEPPRPHGEVLELMATCDALALPSIVEGRALVQQEAMAQGLALIATPNAGGHDLVEDGRAGFLVPIRAPEILAEKISWLADHRDALREMQREAVRVASALTWRRYSEKILLEIAPAQTGNTSAKPALEKAPA
jgi:glycosyltransferase involved in cell wall biosynthesis